MPKTCLKNVIYVDLHKEGPRSTQEMLARNSYFLPENVGNSVVSRARVRFVAPKGGGKLLSVTNCEQDALNQIRLGGEAGDMPQRKVHIRLESSFLSSDCTQRHRIAAQKSSHGTLHFLTSFSLRLVFVVVECLVMLISLVV
jgi:hypothetical protein